MQINNLTAYGETQTCTLGFGGKEGIFDLFQIFLTDPRAIVFEKEPDG